MRRHVPARLWTMSLVVLLGAVGISSAFAAHLGLNTGRIGSGHAAVSRCMTGSQMTFTYNVDDTGHLSTSTSPYGVVVDDIPSSCAGGLLKVELAGSTGPLPESLGSVTIGSSSPCSLSGVLYTCDFQVSGTIAPTSITSDYAVITGP